MSTEIAPSPEEKSAPPVKPARRGHSVDRPAMALSVLVQLVVGVAILVMLNYLGYRHFIRWDHSRNQKFALAPLTKNVLKKLKDQNERVQAIVWFPTAQVITEDVAALLREYEFASDKHVTVEYVSYRNLTRAKDLSEKYKFGAGDNIVILDYKGKSKFVNAQDMAEIDQGNPMMQQQPVVRAFKGEEAITSALMEITEEKQNKLYLVSGHGEPDPEAQEISDLKRYLERQNIKLEKVNLSNVDAVPADASGVLLFGPKQDLSDREIKLLGDYWGEKKGRLLVLLSGAAKTPRLDAWLASQGVKPQNDRVIRTGLMPQMNENNQLVLRNGIQGSAAAVFNQAGKDITKDIVGVNIQLLGASESLAIDQSKAPSQGLKITPLMESMEGFWGETELAAGGQVFFDPSKDHAGPLTLAAAVEKGALNDARVKVDTARMIVVGNAGFLTYEGLSMSEVGLDFALNAINWAFNREQIAGIPPKSKDKLKLSIDEKRMNQLALLVILAIPLAVGAVGAIVWARRSY
jgi:hypothetical protein